MMIKICLFFMIFLKSSFAVEKKNYRYKKYEKFDFEAFSIQGDSSSPGDISVNPRFRVKFNNRLPKKENFNKEALDALDMIE